MNRLDTAFMVWKLLLLWLAPITRWHCSAENNESSYYLENKCDLWDWQSIVVCVLQSECLLSWYNAFTSGVWRVFIQCCWAIYDIYVLISAFIEIFFLKVTIKKTSVFKGLRAVWNMVEQVWSCAGREGCSMGNGGAGGRRKGETALSTCSHLPALTGRWRSALRIYC